MANDQTRTNMNKTFPPTTLRQNPVVDRYARMMETGFPVDPRSGATYPDTYYENTSPPETGPAYNTRSSRLGSCGGNTNNEDIYSNPLFRTIKPGRYYNVPPGSSRQRYTTRQRHTPIAVSTPKRNPIYTSSAREIDLSSDPVVSTIQPASYYSNIPSTSDDSRTASGYSMYNSVNKIQTPSRIYSQYSRDAVNTPSRPSKGTICQSSKNLSKMPPDSLEPCQDDILYEMDECVVNSLGEPTGDYVVSLKSRLDKNPVQKFTVMEHFHRLMKETLGERLYASLLKKGVLSKNLPDEIITRKIMDALELKNKLLFSSNDATVSAIDKLSFIQAAGSFRGALRAAMSATANIGDRCLEDAATEEVMEYEGVFLKHDKPRPEIRVIGYVGVTNVD